MWILAETMIGITKASSDFKCVESVFDKYGSVIIMKNNDPVYVVYNPDDYDISAFPRMSVREVSHNFSSLIYKIYDAGYVVVTKRNKPAFLFCDYKIVVGRKNQDFIQYVKPEYYKNYMLSQNIIKIKEWR